MNVILVILDSLRKDHVRAYGNDQIMTPTLDAVAKEGLRFTRAHPDAMPTIPARRAIHTVMVERAADDLWKIPELYFCRIA
jgi:arylsulfatase A-like enzyme